MHLLLSFSIKTTARLISSHFKLKNGSIIILLFVLTSCGSVPLTTLIKMSSIDQHEVAGLSSDEIRVRLTIDEPVRLANQSVRLELKFDYQNAPSKRFLFQLENTHERESVSQFNWFSADVERSLYQFKLSRLAQLEFQNYQKSFISNGKPTQYYWTVYYYLAPSQQQQARIDIELQLAKFEEFFYLLKNAPVELKSNKS